MTKLLIATKQLLEGLTLWSNRKMNEEQVSDIFVQLATQFNLASKAFHAVNIDTSELAHIPDDLRNCLETALGEEPSPASLDQYLPRIKEVIITLLQGLRLKQNLYREQHEARTARMQAASSSGSSSSGRSRSRNNNHQQPSSRSNSATRSPDMEGVSKIQQQQQQPMYGATLAPPTLSVSSPSDEQGHAETLASLRKSDAITRRASSRRHSQRFSTLLEQNTPPVPRRNYMNDPALLAAYPGGLPGSQSSTPATSPNAPLSHGQFPSMPDPSAYMTGLGTSASRLDGMPQPPTIPVPPPPPPAATAAAATTAAATAAASQPPEPQPQQQSIPSANTSPQLGSSMLVNALSPETDSSPQPSLVTNGSSETVGTPSGSSLAGASSATSLPAADTPGPVEPQDTSLTLFLQVGKSVKKTKFEGELTLSGLRMLFMEKFQYNPGQEDFPTIYVKDPNTNIHYELESLADVKQNAFLSLNVDDLENIQRKMDQGFAVLSKELQELKRVQESAETARQKAATAAAAAAAVVNNAADRSVAANSESSQMLRSVVSKVLAKNKAAVLEAASAAAASSSEAESAEGQEQQGQEQQSPAQQPTVQSKIDVTTLKSHYDEVQTLRRDLGVVRQLYSEFQDETKSMLGSLTTYSGQLRKQTLDQPVSSRVYIESGKVKLDKISEELTNKIEDLQDVVEDMKTNVTQRRGRPSDHAIGFAEKQCDQIGKEIEELSDFIQSLRPSWKKTWEVELQTIVKEQQFLKEQEALLEDLKEDRGSLVQTLNNLRKVLELQLRGTGVGAGGAGAGGGPVVFQPTTDDSFEGLKTVLEEVKMIEPDSDKRLRAMAHMEKLRHIELSNRIDEFEDELTSFVGESKLRKTGGALEVERLRQQRDSENLKAMFGKKEGSGEDAAAAAAEAAVPGQEAEAPAEDPAELL